MRPSIRIEQLTLALINDLRHAFKHQPKPEKLQWVVFGIVKYLDEEYEQARKRHSQKS